MDKDIRRQNSLRQMPCLWGQQILDEEFDTLFFHVSRTQEPLGLLGHKRHL